MIYCNWADRQIRNEQFQQCRRVDRRLESFSRQDHSQGKESALTTAPECSNQAMCTPGMPAVPVQPTCPVNAVIQVINTVSKKVLILGRP